MRKGRCVTLAQLEEYSAGRLPGRKERAIRKHIEACAECSELWDRFLADEKFLRKVRDAHADRGQDEAAWDRLSDTISRVEEDIE
jgi:hypothetical protein